MFKSVKYILLIGFVGVNLAAVSSSSSIYLENRSNRPIDIYVDNMYSSTLDAGKGEVISSNFQTLSYKDKSGQLTTIVDASELPWRLDDDLYVTFTYDKPSRLKPGSWKVNAQWKNRAQQEKEWSKDWVEVSSLTPEQIRELAQDPSKDPKTLEQLKHFLVHNAPFVRTRENQEKFLRTTFPGLKPEQINEILDSL